MQGDILADEKMIWEEYYKNIQGYLESAENTQKINEMIANGRKRLSVNLDNLRRTFGPDSKICDDFIKNPTKALKMFQQHLQQKVEESLGQDVDAPLKKKGKGNVMNRETQYKITFEGNFGRYLITPRGLTSNLVNFCIAVQGIVTRISIVRPKLIQSVHFCENTKAGSVREYNDDYDLTAEKNLKFGLQSYPLKDAQGNPLTTEYGYSQFKDFQTLLLQEMPEKAPTGLLPRSIEVILQEDLVDQVKPGDRVQVTGVYKCLANSVTTHTGILKSVLVATGINVLSQGQESNEVDAKDIAKIKEVAQQNTQDLLKLLSSSVAPSIQGQDEIKKAIILMLLGGVEKNLENNAHLRGDINILMIGDPSTAKSQLLRRVLSIAKLAINTTGRGSSGVGLTAAVTFDKDTGERNLEAGAMVLADRGVVCIDEFDKMNEADRVAIHEVMEQQTVTIAKAGIHTSLNARCSVIAAANPIYGEYQKDLPPTKNIGLPDSLLSRFDLLFIVLDENDQELDRLVAERVTRNHRYVPPNQELAQVHGNYNSDDYVIEPEFQDTENSGPYEKHNNIIHAPTQTKLLTLNFLKKYITYAKEIKPQLTEEASNFISDTFKELRSRNEEENLNSNGIRNQSITIRTLETLIRLASAHAKLRLSRKVEKQDCMVAKQLVYYTIFNDRDGVNYDNDDDSEDGDDGQGRNQKQQRQTRSSTKKPRTTSQKDRIYVEEDEDLVFEETKQEQDQRQFQSKRLQEKQQKKIQDQTQQKKTQKQAVAMEEEDEQIQFKEEALVQEISTDKQKKPSQTQSKQQKTKQDSSQKKMKMVDEGEQKKHEKEYYTKIQVSKYNTSYLYGLLKKLDQDSQTKSVSEVWNQIQNDPSQDDIGQIKDYDTYIATLYRLADNNKVLLNSIDPNEIIYVF